MFKSFFEYSAGAPIFGNLTLVKVNPGCFFAYNG